MTVGQKGMRSGLHPYRWRQFKPALDCWGVNAGLGVGTPPTLGYNLPNTAGQAGRFLYLKEERLCFFEFALTFGTIGNAPGGGTQNVLSGAYLVELPVAARLLDQYLGPNSGGDRPIGTGVVARGNGTGTPLNPVVPILYSVSDFGASNGNKSRNKWAQMFQSGCLVNGSGSISGTSLVVTFPYPIAGGGFTVNPSDIHVVFTSDPSPSSGHFGYWLSNVSGTGFTLNLNNAPAATASFSYSVNSKVGVLVNALAPFNLGATPGDTIRGMLVYETAQ